MFLFIFITLQNVSNTEVLLYWQTAEIAAAQEKQMEVCEVCGAFLIVGDAQSRIDDHLMGKQHVGYARLRMALEEIMVSQPARPRPLVSHPVPTYLSNHII